jgi:MerR family copper efflux transcriptional regulator
VLSIGDICERTGLSPRTVRYYEEVGLLPDVRRREGGRRVYASDEEERLRFITRLKTLGLSLSEIKELNAVHALAGSTGAMLERLEELLDAHQDELDHRIEELGSLRDQIRKYRSHVSERVDALAAEGKR